jgi:hypothetical protein
VRARRRRERGSIRLASLFKMVLHAYLLYWPLRRRIDSTCERARVLGWRRAGDCVEDSGRSMLRFAVADCCCCAAGVSVLSAAVRVSFRHCVSLLSHLE